MRWIFAPILLVPILLCSCNSRIPEPVTYHYSQQHKMQAAAHWQVLAADLAERINKQLIMTDNLHKAVFVKKSCGDEATPCRPGETTSFDEAFHDLLLTNLFNTGVPAKSLPDADAIDILYKVQVVQHVTQRVRSLQPGILTGLSTAVSVLRNAPVEAIVIATGVAADIANSNLVDSGHYEVIITTSLVYHHRYLFRASDIYYINEKDFFQYQENMPQAATIRLSGDRSRQSAPQRDISAPEEHMSAPQMDILEPAVLETSKLELDPGSENNNYM